MNLLLLVVDPPDLSGGHWAAPGWLILTLGGLVATGAAAVAVLRWRRRGDRA